MPGLVGPGETIANQLYKGPGAGPMLDAAQAYTTLANAMNNGADNSDGTMDGMQNIWKGPSAHRAESAFRNHSSWVRKQASHAHTAAHQAGLAASAFIGTKSATPPPEVFTGLRATITALSASNAMNVNTIPIAATTTALAVANVEAVVAYSSYTTAMQGIVMGLPPIPAPAPTIVSSPTGPGGGGSTSGPSGSGPGPTPTGSTPPTSTSPTSNPPSTSGPTNSGPTTTDPGSGATQTGSQPGNTDPGSNPTPSDPQQTTGVQDSAPSNDLSAPDNNLGFDPSQLPDSSSSYSADDLAGMGAGAYAALSLSSGGLGSMAGAATGFRMPSNWGQLTGGRAFGAGTGLAEPEPAMQRRGITAPEMQRRRKREEEKKRKAAAKVSGKVFVPGELDEVPELEQPPAIGVLEYDLDPLWDETSEDDSDLIGVLEHDDDWSSTEERPR
ncbi:PPE family protein [Nocardia sp. alder85J]|uniref:PPE family protein n=1 Tax=Nocardia sp. alder85J TaxID=2862949 RepID=UPI001CD69E68|nr:PPE family protein [Nocardia sp. alder85J]MCX4092194.1 PPE family protein [Nocardia sp. alder85J]